MPDLLHEVNIDASPQKVYEAVATQQGLRAWWTRDSTAEERVEGRAQFGFMKRAVVFRMTIDELAPAKRIVWTCQWDHDEWKGTTLTWDIVPDGRGTTLRFRHANWRTASHFFASCNSTWGELMYRLKGYVEGKNPGPHWTE